MLAFRIKPNSLSEIYACIIAISLIAHYLYSLTGPAIRASQTTINGCPTMLPRTMRAANIGTIRPCVICIICISCCAPIRTGGNPRLNLSSEGHGADQGERHQDGGEEAEETSRWDDYWEAAYHTGISSFPIYLLDFGGPVSCCNIIIPHPTEKEKSVSCK